MNQQGNSTYFSDLVAYYEQLKETESKKRIQDIYYPTSVKNIYAPENDCHKTLEYGLVRYGVDKYDIIEFFIWSCNNNKFSTKEDIDKFYKFITKDIQDPKYKIIPDNLLKQISEINDPSNDYRADLLIVLQNLDNLQNGKIKEKKSSKLYTLFIHALIEKTPLEFITNDFLRKIIKLLDVNKIDFVQFANQKGLEFDAKTLKALKDKKYNMSTIKSKDVNMNIKKYNSNIIETLFIEKDFEACKKIFYDSLKSNNIDSNKMTQVFAQIDLYLNTLITYKYIENIIKMKLYYDAAIFEQDIYLLAQYQLTEKLRDNNLIKEIIQYLNSKNVILDFFNTNNSIIKFLNSPQNAIPDPEDQYHWMKDCRINYREILENIIAMGFNIKKCNQSNIKFILQIFEKHVKDYVYNIDHRLDKLQSNYDYKYDTKGNKEKDEKKNQIQQQIDIKMALKKSFLESIKSFDIIDNIYSGEYNKEFIRTILVEYHHVFADMIKTKKCTLKLIDNDIISIVFALNLDEAFEQIIDNKFIIEHNMTEYILYTPNIEKFLKSIYKYNIRLTNQAYVQLQSLIPKSMLKTLELKEFILDDDNINSIENLSITLSEKLNKMSLNEQILYIQNHKNLSINDVLNLKNPNAKTYIINYMNQIKKTNSTINQPITIESLEKPKKVIVKKVIKKIVHKKADNNTTE